MIFPQWSIGHKDDWVLFPSLSIHFYQCFVETGSCLLAWKTTSNSTCSPKNKTLTLFSFFSLDSVTKNSRFYFVVTWNLKIIYFSTIRKLSENSLRSFLRLSILRDFSVTKRPSYWTQSNILAREQNRQSDNKTTTNVYPIKIENKRIVFSVKIVFLTITEV